LVGTEHEDPDIRCLSTLLILFSGCAGTTVADRMPHAVDGITSVLAARW
jgi:hypothetical protein